MRKVRKEIQRQALYGWLWWAPMPTLILGVLVVDAWLNIQTRRHDYEMNTYKSEITRLEGSLDEAGVQLDAKKDYENLELHAKKLGLRDPEAGQVRVLMLNDVTYAGANLVLARTEDAPEAERVPRRAELPAVPVAPVMAPPPAVEGDASEASESAAVSAEDLDASLESLLESI
jgi:hypothetical protein